MKNCVRLLLIVSALSIMAFGCWNEIAPTNEIAGAQKAIVVFEGDPSVDGCGWLLSIDDKLYYPVNLKAAYQVDSLKVSVKYETQTGTWNCGWRNPGYEKIEIKEISQL